MAAGAVSRDFFRSLLAMAMSLAVLAAAPQTSPPPSSAHPKSPPKNVVSISFEHLTSSGSPTFPSAAKAARDALLTAGVLQIAGIPNFGASREAALKDLASCLEEDNTALQMNMVDGSKRISTATASDEGVGGEFESRCGAASAELRKAVDLGTRHLFLALDTLVMDAPAARRERTSMIMNPYKTYGDILRRGEHLEHLHAYFSSPAGSATASSETADSTMIRKASLTLPTMEFHTDGGMFIGMTTGYYQGQSASVDSGLYIRKADGTTEKAVLDDDNLIVLVGEAGARWLSPVLGSPLVATTHALIADLSTGSDGVAATRAWYGKMYLPPKDAFVPGSQTIGVGDQPMSYENYRTLEKEAIANKNIFSSSPSGKGDDGHHWSSASTKDISALQSQVLPVACGVSNMGLVSPFYNSDGSRKVDMQSTTSCTTSGGLAGAYCWMQCVSLTSINCTSSTGYTAVCVNTKLNNTVADPMSMCGNDCQLKCYEHAPSAAPTAAPTAVPTVAPSAAPQTSSSSSNGCFSAHETVTLENGNIKPITEVVVGDRILTSDSKVPYKLVYSDVVYLPHEANKLRSSFLLLTTRSGKDIKMTPGHLLPAGDCNLPSSSSLPLRMASEITTGMCVMTIQDDTAAMDEVIYAEMMPQSEGIYSVVTANDGYVVISGFVASPFAYVHWLPNAYYNIHRMVYQLMGSNPSSVFGVNILKGANVLAGFVASSYLSIVF